MIHLFEVTVSLYFHNTSTSKFPPDLLFLLRYFNKQPLSQQFCYILCVIGTILRLNITILHVTELWKGKQILFYST